MMAWPWGNHEFDYGAEAFGGCTNHTIYPTLSSGLVYSDTLEPYLPEYQIYELDGVRMGAFAVAGDDFPCIVRPELIPAGTRWVVGEEKLARVAQIVETLRHDEAADLVSTTNFQALIAADYKELFAAAQNLTHTEININELVSAYIRTNSPVSAERDGRIKIADD